MTYNSSGNNPRYSDTNLSIVVVVVVDPVPTSTPLPTPSLTPLKPRLIVPQLPQQTAPGEQSLEPDMGAVYILLGCLAVSGLVVLGILAYCTSYCWRKRCFNSRRTVPTIKISASCDDGYLALKQMGEYFPIVDFSRATTSSYQKNFGAFFALKIQSLSATLTLSSESFLNVRKKPSSFSCVRFRAVEHKKLEALGELDHVSTRLADWKGMSYFLWSSSLTKKTRECLRKFY